MNPGKTIPVGMPRIAALFAAFSAGLCLLVMPAAAIAQGGLQSGAQTEAQGGAQDWAQSSGPLRAGLRTVTTASWIEEWDPATRSWQRIAEEAVGGAAVENDRARADAAAPAPENTIITAYSVNGETITETQQTQKTHAAARYAQPVTRRDAAPMLAQYGPFIVIDAGRAAIIGSTDSISPHHFDAMLRDFPQISVLEMVEAPGTSNDIANLAVGRRIRAAGLNTLVPVGGSVRSGAVELFLAGAIRTVEEGAQFAVHSWLDNHGREPDDFAADHPANRLYLDYYVEMGMSEARAREFYAMTNSVPHASARWLVADDMRFWLRPERDVVWQLASQIAGQPVIAPITAFPLPAAPLQWIALERLVLPLILPAIRYGDLTAVMMSSAIEGPPDADAGVTLDGAMAHPVERVPGVFKGVYRVANKAAGGDAA